MTNEEAIKALKRIRDEAINNFVGDWQDYEAFDIAIEALTDHEEKCPISIVFSCEECHRKDCTYKTEPQTDCAWR